MSKNYCSTDIACFEILNDAISNFSEIIPKWFNWLSTGSKNSEKVVILKMDSGGRKKVVNIIKKLI